MPAIGVQAPVEARGTVHYANPFTGQPVSGYGVPESTATTSWWSGGPQPGSGQVAVVLGHDVPGDGAGVFDDIDQLRPGDAVVLTDVALVTCGGENDESAGAGEENVVVFAAVV